MDKEKTLLFITTSNLATNPRLVKEVYLAIENNYSVEIVCFHFDNWSAQINDQLSERLAGIATIHRISTNSKKMLKWVTSGIVARIIRGFAKVRSNPLLTSLSERRSILLLHFLTSRNWNHVNLIIAHNPYALYPTYCIARKYKIPFGFDIEDYHPGETKDVVHEERMRNLMQKYLHYSSYLTAASPLILERVTKDLGEYGGRRSVINNAFPASEFHSKCSPNTGKLKLVWFSQNIGKGRGVENIVKQVGEFEDEIELHLIGNLNNEFYKSYLDGISNVVIKKPLPQVDLHKSLSLYDIGLAIEPSKDLNNDLALSNKLFAYLQAGLYIAASETPAQKLFLDEHKSSGLLFNINDKHSIKKALLTCISNKEAIRETFNQRFKHNNSICWEIESEELKRIWNRII